MNSTITLTQGELSQFLLHVAVVRPVFIWGAPGIGKSSLVRRFADEVGLPCVSLLGSQLAPEDLIGVPQIVDGTSVFHPPRQIARAEPYCLFLDELNACSLDVMKAFYSLILERRVGEYTMPPGSIVIGAGNRSQDSAVVRPMPSALVNRLVHVHLRVDHRDWMDWAYANGTNQLVTNYVATRPDHLWSEPPKHEEPFSTPRSWHMLSDALNEYAGEVEPKTMEILAYGCLSPRHAQAFLGFVKQVRQRYSLDQILKGERRWPDAPDDRDVLFFLATTLRARLIKELPPQRKAGAATDELARQAKASLAALAVISVEVAQLVVAEDDARRSVPDWFLTDVIRDLPRLAGKKNGA